MAKARKICFDLSLLLPKITRTHECIACLAGGIRICGAFSDDSGEEIAGKHAINSRFGN